MALCHRRWSLPVLGALSGGSGLRFAEMTGRLGVSRQPLRETLGLLIDLGYLKCPGGHGHPLRPEYTLSSRGSRVASAVGDLLDEIKAGDQGELLLRKWSLPLLSLLSGTNRRFAEFAPRLTGLGPRALALALRDLEAAELVDRTVGAGRPPSVRYSVRPEGDPLLARLRSLLNQLG